MICKPCGVAVALAALILGAARAEADLIVVENGVPDVLRITDTGSSKTVFTTANLNSPIGINADTAGNIYVVDANQVSKYTPTGAPLGFYVQNPATLSGPVDIAFDPANNGYVTNQNTGGTSFIGQYNAAGVFQQSFGTASTNVPTGIGYDPVNGRLYVSNSGNNTITVYNPANLAGTPTVVNSGLGLDSPEQIAFDAAGNVYVANFGVAGLANVEKFSTTAAGNLTLVQTFTPTGQVAGSSAGAEGVAVDPLGNVYVSLINRGTIEKFNPAGTDLGAIATGLNNVAFLQYQVAPQAVPEPGSLALAGVAAVGALGYRLARRNRRAQAA